MPDSSSLLIRIACGSCIEYDARARLKERFQRPVVQHERANVRRDHRNLSVCAGLYRYLHSAGCGEHTKKTSCQECCAYSNLFGTP